MGLTDYGRSFELKQSHFGKDTYGHDVKAFGDTTGKYVFWDASADTLYVVGTLALTGTFNSGNIALIDAETLTFGTGSDVVMQWDGTNFLISAAADDSLIEIGDSAVTQKSFDLKWYANEASGASYLYADASANLIYTVGVDLQFKDADLLVFGTGAGAAGDVSIVWDGTNLIINAVADDTLIEIGDSATSQLSFDLKWYGGSASGASFLYADASADLIYTTGVDLQFKDNDFLVFGTGAGATGDINITWNATNLVMASVAASSGWLIGAASFVINTTQHGTITVGVDDTGYDVKMFGATAGKYLLWDESADKLIILGAYDITGNSQLSGTVTVGVDDTGYDVTFFGATTGCKMLWDESEDQLVLTGPADVPALKIVGAGSYCNFTTYAALGAAWADTATPAFIADQGYMIIDLNGTLYRIPLWANA